MVSVLERAQEGRHTLSRYTRQTILYSGDPIAPQYTEQVLAAEEAVRAYTVYMDGVNDRVMDAIPDHFAYASSGLLVHTFAGQTYHFRAYVQNGVLRFHIYDMTSIDKIDLHSDLYDRIVQSMLPVLRLCGFIECDHTLYRLGKWIV